MTTAGASLLSLHPVQSSTRCKRALSHRSFILGDLMVLRPSFFTGNSLACFRSRFIPPVSALALPTAKPEEIVNDKNLRWSARAVKSFALGEHDAWKFGWPHNGTESLLLGILIDGTSEGAKFLISKGITLDRARIATKKITGDLDFINVPETMRLSPSAQRVLDSALDLKIGSGGKGEVTVAHLILAIWSDKNCTGHKVLASLGFNSGVAKELKKNAEHDAAPTFR